MTQDLGDTRLFARIRFADLMKLHGFKGVFRRIINDIWIIIIIYLFKVDTKKENLQFVNL